MKRAISKEDWEKLSDEMKALYKLEGDGQYHLQIEGDDPQLTDLKEKITEFRNNNTILIKQVEEYKKKYGDFDPDEYKELKKKMQLIEDKKLLDEGKIDELLDQRTEQMKKEYENRIEGLEKNNNELKTELTTTTNRLADVLIDGKIREAATRVGVVRQGAMEDVVSRGRKTWKLNENQEPVPYKSDGVVLLGPDAKTPISFDEWAKNLMESAPHFFEPNKGANSGGGGGGGGGGMSEDLKKLPPTDRLTALRKQAKQ